MDYCGSSVVEGGPGSIRGNNLFCKGKAAYDRRFSLPSQSGSLVCLGLPLVWLKGGLEG